MRNEEKRPHRKVIVTGSLSFDYIFDFPGKFSDHILPQKTHLLNLSFAVAEMKKHCGGTGGNIAYNLALLGERPFLLAAAGPDFSVYRQHLLKVGVDLSWVTQFPHRPTAVFFVITDRDDNQIGGFYEGAMRQAGTLSLTAFVGQACLVVIAPNDPVAMLRYVRECQTLRFPYLFDPGQQTIQFQKRELRQAIKGAEILIGNDYEIELMKRETRSTIADFLGAVGAVIVTRGGHGSEIFTGSKKFVVPAVSPRRLIDPTGAGDAYRAGIIKGWLRGWDWEKTGRVAALAATYAIEKHGTQEHTYAAKAFLHRYERTFGPAPFLRGFSPITL